MALWIFFILYLILLITLTFFDPLWERNVFGNIVCLMPLALFIPILFKKINNTKKFLIVILCVTLGIELVQFITYTGSCDIDDIILNTLGAFIMYKIINITDINNLIKNILLLEKNGVNKKKVLIVSIPIILVIILVFGLYKVGQSFYQENLDKWTSKRNCQFPCRRKHIK